jgi:5-methyltetrahydrofolate--homocysteine methyltransferase
MAIQDIYQAVMQFDEKAVADLTKAELEAGTDIHMILQDALIAPMDEVGRRFSEGKLFVPEMLVAAKAMKAGLAVLKLQLTKSRTRSAATVVIGTVQGDLHDIGKNLVGMMLEGAGFEVVDIGVDAEPEKFLAAAKGNNANVVALSALLTTTMPAMGKTIDVFRKNGTAIKVIVGGAPVSKSFADKIGADGYAEDAPGAVNLVRSILRG